MQGYNRNIIFLAEQTNMAYMGGSSEENYVSVTVNIHSELLILKSNGH